MKVIEVAKKMNFKSSRKKGNQGAQKQRKRKYKRLLERGKKSKNRVEKIK
jgi:hypothetical protein